MPAEAGFVSFVGVAHPWVCDAMGHVNVRHYAAMFDDASFQVLGRIATPKASGSLGWADVRCEIDYRQEIAAGTLLTIRSYIEKVGRSSLTYTHVLHGSLDNEIYAQARMVTVRFDLVARCKVDLDPASRTQAEALIDRKNSPSESQND